MAPAIFWLHPLPKNADEVAKNENLLISVAEAHNMPAVVVRLVSCLRRRISDIINVNYSIDILSTTQHATIKECVSRAFATLPVIS